MRNWHPDTPSPRPWKARFWQPVSIIAKCRRRHFFWPERLIRTYRRRGGEKPGVLSDFFIGAHAAVLGVPLLTRDARRFRRYFPSVLLLTP